MIPNVLNEPPSKFKVGFPDSYEDGKVVERFKDQNAWIVKNDGTARKHTLSAGSSATPNTTPPSSRPVAPPISSSTDPRSSVSPPGPTATPPN